MDYRQAPRRSTRCKAFTPKKTTFVYNKRDQSLKKRRIPKNVSHVILDGNVTQISSRSLEDLDDLVQVNCSSSRRCNLQMIGESAMEDCTSLEAVIGLPQSLHTIQKNAFLLCESLTQVKLPRMGLRIIGEGAFASCSSLESMVIPATVESIGNCAFASCTSLSDLTFHSNNQNGGCLTRIGDRAFSCCSSLTNVDPPVTIQYIGKSAFELCTMLRIVRMRTSEGLQKIEEFTFAWCKRLKIVELPLGLVRIHRGAFKGCTSLELLPLPPQLQSIGREAFYDSGLRKLEVPSSVTIIKASACQHCHSLGEVELQVGLKEIGNWAFANCKALRTVFLPPTLETVGDGAFRDCLNLLGIEIPKKASMKLGQYVFQHCKSLYSISMDEEMSKSFPGTTFSGCSRLKVLCGESAAGEDHHRPPILFDSTILNPANEHVYFSRAVSIGEFKSQLTDCISLFLIATGTTPFHVLVASPELRHDVFLALLDKHQDSRWLSCMDLWGKTMMDYLLQLATKTFNSKVVSFLKLVIQKTVVDRIQRWGIPRQQREIEKFVDGIDWKNETTLYGHVEVLYRQMGRCERQEFLSILELALWKTKRREVDKEKKHDKSSSDEDRMICGSFIVIPSVMQYLWEAGSRPPTSIAFGSCAIDI